MRFTLSLKMTEEKGDEFKREIKGFLKTLFERKDYEISGM